MDQAVEHAASIAIAKLKAEGRVDDTVSALLDLIQELENEADDAALELARLHHIGEIAKSVMAQKPMSYPVTLDDAATAVDLLDDIRIAFMDLKS